MRLTKEPWREEIKLVLKLLQVYSLTDHKSVECLRTEVDEDVHGGEEETEFLRDSCGRGDEDTEGVVECREEVSQDVLWGCWVDIEDSDEIVLQGGVVDDPWDLLLDASWEVILRYIEELKGWCTTALAGGQERPEEKKWNAVR